MAIFETMRKILLATFVLITLAAAPAKAQFDTFRDSVVQIYGVVMTADSLKALQSVTIMVRGQNRGTITNEQGVFSIVVLKGDQIDFTSVGYKPKTVTIPKDLKENQYSLIQLLVTDTIYLPATIIKSRPTREQFARDFVNTPVPTDNIEIARQNTDEAKRRILIRSTPADGREGANYTLRQAANRYYSAGQAPPIGILNPLAWADFFKAWKRGDFKKKK